MAIKRLNTDNTLTIHKTLPANILSTLNTPTTYSLTTYNTSIANSLTI